MFVCEIFVKPILIKANCSTKNDFGSHFKNNFWTT